MGEINPNQAVPNQTILPRATDILRGMNDAESPLDFIKANLKPETPLEPKTIIQEVEAKREEVLKTESIPTVEETPTAPPLPQTPVTNLVEESKQEPVAEEQKPIEEPTQTSDSQEDTATLSPNSKEENFKKLRTKLHETASTLKEKEKTLEDLQTKVQKYETGEEVPEVLREKEDRIRELEKYERLHALKLSPAYKESFIKPLQDVQGKLMDIAADYEIPSEVMREALNLTSRRELNSFLAEHFDEVGVMEVKELVTQAQKITEAARAAEEEPVRALEAIEADYQSRIQEKKVQDNQRVTEQTREAWADNLSRIRQEGKILELIPREGDDDFNEKIVRPILDAAGKESGRLIRQIQEEGLSKEVISAIIRMTQLAHASAVSIDTRQQALEEAETIKKNAERNSRYLRPAVGSTNVGGGGGHAPTQPTSPKEAADVILNSVLSRRGN